MLAASDAVPPWSALGCAAVVLTNAAAQGKARESGSGQTMLITLRRQESMWTVPTVGPPKPGFDVRRRHRNQPDHSVNTAGHSPRVGSAPRAAARRSCIDATRPRHARRDGRSCSTCRLTNAHQRHRRQSTAGANTDIPPMVERAVWLSRQRSSSSATAFREAWPGCTAAIEGAIGRLATSTLRHARAVELGAIGGRSPSRRFGVTCR
jgi:hypothetical protein